MRITIKDVAKYANVSPATVSLVLNNRPGVNVDTKKRVHEATKRLGYVPNQIARGLVCKKQYVLGLVVTNIDNPFFTELIMEVQKAIEKTGYRLLLGYSGDKVLKEKKTIEYMIEQGVDGLLIVPSRDGEQELEHMYRLKQLGIPFVFLTSTYRGIQSDCVMSDLEQAMYEATRMLLMQGKRKIYFITDKRALFLSALRIQGYQRAFEEEKIKYRNDWIVETVPEIENGIAETARILKIDKPDAIITLNAIVAMGAMKCLRDNEVKVPEDIAVLCFDDLLYLSILYTPVTSIKQSVSQIARKGVQQLIARIDGEEEGFIMEKIPAELVLRESTQ